MSIKVPGLHEWEELFIMGIGQSKFINASIEIIRVPGGVIYKSFESYPQTRNFYDQSGSYQSQTTEEISVSITFSSFPPGLYEKLSQL
jgi:hypothetical protein